MSSQKFEKPFNEATPLSNDLNWRRQGSNRNAGGLIIDPITKYPIQEEKQQTPFSYRNQYSAPRSNIAEDRPL